MKWRCLLLGGITINTPASNHGALEMKNLFGTKKFDFTKARKLVEDCIEVASGNSDKDVVLDFFAGSGTTGHAVININREEW